MKSKEKELYEFLQKNDMSMLLNAGMLGDEMTEKNLVNYSKKARFDENKIAQQNKEKLQKIQEKMLEQQLAGDKFSKNVISTRNEIKRKNQKLEKRNSKRIKKCNDQLLQDNLEEKEIYLTIDKFNTNGKKTVVYFIDSFFPVIDGVVSVLDNYAVQMQKYYNVVICAPKHKQVSFKTDKYFVLSADSIHVKKQGYDLGFPQLDVDFQWYLSLLKIDLIHVQAPFNMGNFGLSLAKRRKIPCITTFHSQFKQNFYNAVKNEVIAQWLTKILLYVYSRSDVVVTMNTFARKVLKEYGLKKSVEIVPNATNLVKKEFDEEQEEKVLKKYGINKEKFNLLFIGRFVEVKNVYFILDVLKKLFKINKDFNFVFLGYGPEQAKMQKFVKENDMENVVKFTGKIDDVETKSIIIKNTNLLFFPSVYDTDGIVKIECACYDVPTLCIKDTGVASNIVDNHNGFVEENNKEKFVERLDWLIKNVDFVKNVGKNANLDLYITWEGACEILQGLYEKTLKSYNLKKSKNNKNKTA